MGSSYNREIGGPGVGNAPAKISSLPKPSITIAYGEGNGLRWMPYDTAACCGIGGNPPYHGLKANHNNGVNLAFADGHASWYGITQIPNTDTQASKVWVRANPP
jgi:prepilin-type processing-associated H-X9-DG protein